MQYRQGDVQIVKVSAIPEGAKKVSTKVLFYGEVTGHKHQIDVGELFELRDGEFYLKVDKLTKVRHEEHKTITLNPGFYRVTQKRQYDPEDGWSNVVD